MNAEGAQLQDALRCEEYVVGVNAEEVRSRQALSSTALQEGYPERLDA